RCADAVLARGEGAAVAVRGGFEARDRAGAGTARPAARADAKTRGHASRAAAGVGCAATHAAWRAGCGGAGAACTARSAQGALVAGRGSGGSVLGAEARGFLC